MKIRTIERVIDKETGELIETSVSTEGVRKNILMPKENGFVKLYVSFDMFDRYSFSQLRMVARMIPFARYGGIVSINHELKAQIKKDLGYTDDVIRTKLYKMCKSGLLSKNRCDLGDYRINPFLFGKGKWEDIYEQQQAFSPGHQDGETG